MEDLSFLGTRNGASANQACTLLDFFVQVGVLHQHVVLHSVVVDSIVGVRDSKLSWLGGCCTLGCCLGTTSDYLNMDTLDIGMI